MLLAVSGGLDSSVMVHLFAESDYHFAVAHVNFGLRGAESDEDERWVAALAQRHGVPFHTRRVDTQQYADEHGLSIQMAARRLRYAWFEEVRQQAGYARIATAHHQDDQLETALLNLCQGTGIAGLRGMRSQQGSLVRPLLFAFRAQLEAYAHQRALTWREDASNATDAYRRNYLRHRVIPQLQHLNPSLLATYQLTRERLLATEQLLADEVDRVRDRGWQEVNNEVWLDQTVLNSHPQLPLVLSEIIRPFGFTYLQAREVARSIRRDAIPGKLFYSDSHTLVVDRRHLIISEKNERPGDAYDIQENDLRADGPSLSLKMKHDTVAGYRLSRRSDTAALDADRLSFPLTVRPWRAGDWFCPLGMNHRKKISDFLVDQKVPRHRKASVYVVTSNEAIVWVVGWRIDHRFRITHRTQRVYEISVEDNG